MRAAPPLPLVLAAAVMAASAAAAAAPPPPAAGPASTASPGAAVNLPAAPRPTSRPKLQTIATVRVTTPLCRAALQNADIGVQTLLSNDTRVAAATTELRTVDFDKDVIREQNGLNDLRNIAALIAKQAAAGNETMKLLKAEAAQVPSESQRRDMLAFQQALDGALMRQKRMGVHLGRMVVYLQNHPQIDPDTRADLNLQAVIQQSEIGAYHDPKGPFDEVPRSLDWVAQTVAGDLTQREADVANDEGTAAERIDSAFAKC